MVGMHKGLGQSLSAIGVMKHFFKDFMIYGMAGVVGKIAALLLMPVYTGILSKEEYGAMSLLLVCYGIISLFACLNIHSGVARDYYEEGVQRKKLVSTGFYAILFVSLSVCLCMLASRHFWMSSVLRLPEKFERAFIVMLISVPFGSLQSYFFLLTRFKKAPVTYMVGTLISLFIRLGVSIYGVVVLRAGIISVFIGGLCAEVFSILFFGIVNRKYIDFTFCWDYLRRALIFSLPTLPAILAGWVDTNVGQVLIARNISVEDLGVYSIALSLASVFTLISEALNNIWAPYLFENYKKESFLWEIRRLFVWIVSGLIVVSFLLSLLSEPLVLLLSRPSYVEAGKYLSLLCLPMCIYLLFPFASAGVSVSRDTKHVGIAYVSGSALNLLCLFFCLPHWGIISVPLCLALSRITAYSYLYIVSRRKMNYRLPNVLIVLLAMVVLGCYLLKII